MTCMPTLFMDVSELVMVLFIIVTEFDGLCLF